MNNKMFLMIFIFLSMKSLACESVIPAVVHLDVNNFYSDKKNSVVDPDRLAKHNLAVKPIEEYMQFLAKQSDQYALDPKKSKSQGLCVLKWISNWAEAGALTGDMKTQQAFYERKWMLAGISLVYGKVKELATTDQNLKIQSWLSKLADLTIEHSDHQKWPKNNHYFWEGLAVGAVGKITNQSKYLNWADKVFQFAMNEIKDDGSLPKEMARGQRALHYHLFSAAPLVFLSSILNKNSPRLNLLVEFTFQSLQDPGPISKMAGVAQEAEKDRDMAWLEIYLRRHPNTKMESFLKSKRPLYYSKLGGNLTLPNPLECLLGICK